MALQYVCAIVENALIVSISTMTVLCVLSRRLEVAVTVLYLVHHIRYVNQKKIFKIKKILQIMNFSSTHK